MACSASYADKPWLKNYQQGVPEHVQYEEITLPDVLERTARQFPKKDALIFNGYKLNFAQVNEMVNIFASCLADFGIRKGDAVAILLPNLIPCVVAYYAILKIGGITVMIDYLYSDRELENQLNDSGAKALITTDSYGNRLIDLRPRTKIQQIVITSVADYLPLPQSILLPFTARGKMLSAEVKDAPDVYFWKDCLSKYPPQPPSVQISMDDTAMYQYTGGTTGISKGVELTHANLIKQIQQFAAWLPDFQRGEEISLGSLPYYHILGLSCGMNFPIYMGWLQVLVAQPRLEFILGAIKKYRPTFAVLMPSVYIGINNEESIKKKDLNSIKLSFCGGAPLPVDVIRAFEKRTGGLIVEGFGLTETSPVTHVNPVAGGPCKVGSVGIPLPDTEARIVDLTTGTKDVPVGEYGELIVKGPQVMKGYKDRPSETAYTLRDGWCYTGDIAYMDEDGYFFIVDRKKDMIITGGFNVYPREIDDVFFMHPGVEEACSIGVPDVKFGEVAKIFVVPKRNEKITKEELAEFAKDRLAVYKVPVEIEFRTELPKTNIGKVSRQKLREEEWVKRKKTAIDDNTHNQEAI